MRRLSALGLSALTVLSLAGCASTPSGSSSPDASSGDLSNTTIRVLNYSGLNEGLISWAGLDDFPYKVEYVSGDLSTAFNYINANQIDLQVNGSDIGGVSAAAALKGDTSWKVGAIWNFNILHQDILVPAGSSIQSVSDLKGKRVAFQKISTSEIVLARALEDAGLSWSDIEPVELSQADAVSAYSGGQADALVTVQNYSLGLQQEGNRVLLDGSQYLYGNGLVLLSEQARQDQNKLAAITDWLSRLNNAFAIAREKPREYIDLASGYTKEVREQAYVNFLAAEKYHPSRIEAVSPEIVGEFQDVANTLSKLVGRFAPYDVSPIFTDILTEKVSGFPFDPTVNDSES